MMNRIQISLASVSIIIFTCCCVQSVSLLYAWMTNGIKKFQMKHFTKIKKHPLGKKIYILMSSKLIKIGVLVYKIQK